MVPNAHTCAVCLGMPGSLPVLNEQVVEYAVRVGRALECRINAVSIWARKNYFYPDLPKGYQISQYDQPLCEHGALEIDTDEGPRRIRILRIHLEEDAGKNVHDAGGGESLVDLNRSGVPLVEIVSEPDIRSSSEAAEYLKALRDVLVYLGVNDGNLEEGSFRCDANVSVMRKGASKYGQRVEVKNINSFRFVQKAIDYEIGRQVELIESGGKVAQETRVRRGQGETRACAARRRRTTTATSRADLPASHPRRVRGAHRARAPELPRAKLHRFISSYGLPAYDAKILVGDRALADLFEKVQAVYRGPAKKLSNWFLGELLRLMKEDARDVGALRFSPTQFASLPEMVDSGELSNNAAKDVFAEMFRTGRSPREIAQEKGLIQVQDAGAVETAVDAVLAANPGEVEKYRAGKKQVLGFLVGQVMKAMKGKGNPALVNAALKAKLGD